MMQKTIVITGGSSGIGLELAKQLAQQGNRVYSFDRQSFPVEQAGVRGLLVDITNDDDVRKGLEQIPEPIDVLINNAGVMRRGTIFDSSEEDFDALFDVHVKGSWLMLRGARAKLAHDAMIVHVSSVHAINRSENPGLYTLAKQTVAEMAKNLAQAMPHYSVKIIFPGPVDTPLARFDVGKEALEQKKKIMQTAEEVADTIIAFLATDSRELHYDSRTREYIARA